MVEAILFASPAPIAMTELRRRLPADADVEAALESLRARYAGRGVTLARAGGAWAFRTAPDLAALFAETAVETRRLSRAGVETLAVIAYHAPVTRAEIEAMRGVAVSRGTVDLLVEMGWVRVGPRRRTPGRPVTYLTTDGFLDHFGLESAGDLPGLSDLRATGFIAGPEGRSPDS